MKNYNNTTNNEMLGCNYSPSNSVFTVFAPNRDKITLAIYDEYDDVIRKEYEMIRDDDYFTYTINEDLEGKFYTYIVEDSEVTDPYSIACSINSQKSAIIDLRKTDPPDFREHILPDNKWEEAILYEVHVADFTGHESSNVKARAKFLGMAEENAFYDNVTTAINHLEELGISHVHLLPIYDYITVNEKVDITKDINNYNWGYDPELYNCVEGSFSTNPYDPSNRIYELKYLIQKLHAKGISVVMDVVYNHTFKSKDSNFNVLAPNYYHRNNKKGFSNGSGCGNEFASENTVASDFIVNSLLYWATEYKIDGFRFDLMALIDIDTIETAIKKLRDINPNIIIYGEPWMAQSSLLAYDKQINIGSQKDKEFSIFNPFFRDALRGDNDGHGLGYVQGNFGYKKEVEIGISGSVSEDLLTSSFFSPLESINYFNAHDNLIIQDKFVKSGVKKHLHERMTIFTFSILMMSQGIPFFHAGNEFLRDKKLDHNSYHSSLDVNGIDWSLKKKHENVFLTIKDLIKFRKESGLFNMSTADEVKEKLRFLPGLKNHLIGYTIQKDGKHYLVVHNASEKNDKIRLSKSMKQNNIKLIWSNGYKLEQVIDIEIEGLTSNVYEIEGEIHGL